MYRYASRLILAALLVGAFGACGGDDDDDDGAIDAAVEPDARPPRGTISMTWQLYNGGVETTCDEAGAQLVSIELVRQGEAAGEADSFNCVAARASTRELDLGTYDVSIDLVNSQGDSLLAEPVQEFGIAVTEGDDTSIGAVLFDLQ